ncbi:MULTISPECIES: SIMPL domain-containing protein [unclassified Streptomyces]|uniref:SIMPL domain-containing protein n=1 Tax=unclassified Streptomyces TaxID=2593676 RepID=UPI0036A262F5
MTQPAAPPHGTPDAPLLIVHGEAEIDAEPEIARIAVTVDARGRDRRTTLDDLTRRNAAALDLIKSYADAVAHVSTGAVTITPELDPHGHGERVHSHHGRVHLTAELTDFTALAELTTRLADLELTRIDGPWWSLRPDSPVPAQARRDAVGDALRRAREYADALGTTLAALVELADTGADRTRPARTPFERGARRAALAHPDEPAAPLDLEPPRLRVTAQVSARFAMRPPRL